MNRDSQISAATCLLAWGLAFLVCLTTANASAQRQEPSPEQLEEVGVTERLNDLIPDQLDFVDERGRRIRLEELFGERPVILTLTYSSCPMLCHLQLDGLVKVLRDLELSPGKDFELINVSIDPNESTQRAFLTKQKHVQDYGRAGTSSGWHFLTGSEENIKALADAVGFRYRYVPERKEYAHAAALIIATPDGRISKYLYGVAYAAPTMRLALVEAGEGKIGNTYDQVLLFCFQYDADSGSYAPIAMRFMQIGGAMTFLALAIGLAPYWFKRQGSVSKANKSGPTPSRADQ